MFKRLLFICIGIGIAVTSYAQQDDLIYNGGKYGKSTPYINVGMGYVKLDTLNCLLINLKVGNYLNLHSGWLADISIQVSEETQERKLDAIPYSFFAFQMGGGYSIIPYKKSKFVLSTSLTGGLGFLMRTYQQIENEDPNTSLTHFYLYAEPTIMGSYTITDGISFGLSSSYRITPNKGSKTVIRPEALDGLNVQLRLNLGF